MIEITPSPEGIKFVLKKNGSSLQVMSWASSAKEEMLPAIAALIGLVEEGKALDLGDAIMVSNTEVSAFGPHIASLLKLPDASPFILDIRHSTTIDRPDFKFEYRWIRPNSQPVLNPRRTGCILCVGNSTYRISVQHLLLVEGMDKFNSTPASQLQERLSHYGEFRLHLPDETQKSIQTADYLISTRVAHARGFSLKVSATNEGFSFDPVLFSGKEFNSENQGSQQALLPPEYQTVFANKRFSANSECQPRYSLGNGWYVVIDSHLQKVLSAVRKVQLADKETRREFLRNPRAHVKAALINEVDQALIDQVFVESDDYLSDRILDIGIRQPVVLPWVVQAKEPWLPPERCGLVVEGKQIPIKLEEIQQLKSKLELALAKGQTSIQHDGQPIPVNEETLNALTALENARDANKNPKEDVPGGKVNEKLQQMSFLIVDNFYETGFSTQLKPRDPIFGKGLPSGLKTNPKKHQIEGIQWLQEAWIDGRPGVLLADDMGLGKTFQSLAFLLWLTQNWRERNYSHAPILIVAPTGLLKNWEQEHQIHLEPIGLGRPTRAYGSELKKLINPATGSLDATRLTDTDWVLTTYETLRDHQLGFASAHFSVMVLDEVQKTKTPGTLMTDAVKVMHADFILAMTGTPVENRLSDLWCIVDTIQPGYLGHLKEFSSAYEAQPNPEKLKNLKQRLDTSETGSAPIMKRRMKVDHLDGLPEKVEHVKHITMPPVQAEAYTQAIHAARQATGPGRMLETLHKIRSLSLHPLQPDPTHPEDFILKSARLACCFTILDDLSAKREKALIFLESIEMQKTLMVLIQRRYKLSTPPLLINGEVAGTNRQSRVNEFQNEPDKFSVMILSPRAGGVGLTLTAANHVIHLSRWWNPAVEDQCTDRVFRIGQRKKVNIYYPLAIHPDPLIAEHSFDLRLHRLLEHKRALSRDLLMPTEGNQQEAKQLFEEIVF